MKKLLMKNKMANNTSKHLAAVCTDPNAKSKWLNDLVEDLLKALSNFKTVMGFQSRKFDTEKPRQNNMSFLLIFFDVIRLTMTQTLNIKYMSLSSDVSIFINVYIFCYHF